MSFSKKLPNVSVIAIDKAILYLVGVIVSGHIPRLALASDMDTTIIILEMS